MNWNDVFKEITIYPVSTRCQNDVVWTLKRKTTSILRRSDVCVVNKKLNEMKFQQYKSLIYSNYQDHMPFIIFEVDLQRLYYLSCDVENLEIVVVHGKYISRWTFINIHSCKWFWHICLLKKKLLNTFLFHRMVVVKNTEKSSLWRSVFLTFKVLYFECHFNRKSLLQSFCRLGSWSSPGNILW